MDLCVSRMATSHLFAVEEVILPYVFSSKLTKVMDNESRSLENFLEEIFLARDDFMDAFNRILVLTKLKIHHKIDRDY